MPIVATKLFMNWVGVTVTPNGGSAISVQQVTSVAPMRSSKLEKFYGDAYAFARLIKSVEKERGITIASGNVGILASIPEDTPCTVVATLADPRNGVVTGGGAITVTLINAVLEKQGAEGQNNKFATGTASFHAFGGVDGTTGAELDPLTIAYV